MCSIKEMLDREEQHNLNFLEADPEYSYYDYDNGCYNLKAKPEYTIKQYQRSAADLVMNNPENIRTPQVFFSNLINFFRFFQKPSIIFSEISLILTQKLTLLIFSRKAKLNFPSMTFAFLSKIDLERFDKTLSF